jgi:serine/threonine-protein kinase
MSVALACNRCGRPMQSTGIRGMCPRCLFACTTAQLGESDSTEPANTPDAELGLSYGQTVGANGRFLLLDKLGEGGMGEVWLASDQELSRESEPELVALKFISREIRNAPHALAALRAEVLRSQRLSHPNIVRIFDLHTHQSTPFIKMEYVEGNSLRRWLDEREDGVMPWRMAAQITLQLASALRYAHETEGIVHRDLKPANLLLSDGPVIKLSDFGIAAATHEGGAGPDGQIMGTLWYASPQQLSGQKARPEDDTYALGVTLYELLSGSLPFEAETEHQLVKKVRYEPPQPINERLRALGRRSEVPAKMAILVHRCLEKDPFNRPKTHEIQHLLPPVVGGEAVLDHTTHAPAQDWEEDAVSRKRLIVPSWLWWVLALVLGGTGWWQDWGGLRSGAKAWLEAQGKTEKKIIAETISAYSNRPPPPPTPVIEENLQTNTSRPPEPKPQLMGQAVVIIQTKGQRAPFTGAFRSETDGSSFPVTNTASYRSFVYSLPPGPFTLTVSNNDGWVMETRIVIQAESTKQIAIGGDSAYLTVHSVPPGASVRWRQRKQPTPSQDYSTPFPSSFLSGWIEFEATMDGYLPLSTNFCFNPLSDKEVTLFLRRCSQPLHGQPWTNSLDMAFIPVGTLWGCAVETRVGDFKNFVATTHYDATSGMYSVTTNGWQQLGFSWQKPGFYQTNDYPVVGVNWFDAVEFCKWLTQREQSAGLLTANQSYRLPTKEQWIKLAAGHTFPWGEDETVAGNYAGTEVLASGWPSLWPILSNHIDRFTRTAPVGSFKPNELGFYDLGGNAAEWCEEKILCGKSWYDGEDDRIKSLVTAATQSLRDPAERHDRNGFRLVIVETNPQPTN